MGKRIPILVVEDEENIRNILDYSLRLDGFDVYLAEKKKYCKKNTNQVQNLTNKKSRIRNTKNCLE